MRLKIRLDTVHMYGTVPIPYQKVQCNIGARAEVPYEYFTTARYVISVPVLYRVQYVCTSVQHIEHQYVPYGA